jgi:small subunit ribosomal protein S6
MREYELYLVIDADAEEEAIEALIEQVSQLITTGDGETAGEVIKVEPRGKRRLTYAIKRKQESQDIIVNFQASPRTLTEIERVLKLNEQVLRYLLVRTDAD